MAYSERRLDRNLKDGAETAVWLYLFVQFVVLAAALFRSRRAYGRTRAAAAIIFVVIWAALFAYVAAGGDSGQPEGAGFFAVVALLALVAGTVLWLVAVKAIDGFDRRSGRPVLMHRHPATLQEVAARKQQVCRQFDSLRGSLPIDALFVAGFGVGAFLGSDLAQLQLLQQGWHTLDQAERTLRSGGQWFFEDGPATPPPLHQQLRRWKAGVTYRQWVDQQNGPPNPPPPLDAIPTCPNCATLTPGARYCPSCGTPISHSAGR